MKLQTRPRAILVTGGSHVRKPILRKRRQRACTFWSRARIGLRGGVRARFSTVSTMLHRSSNGDARRKSGVKVLVDPRTAPLCNRYRLCSSPVHRCSSRVCSDLDSVLTVARPRTVAMPLSRRLVKESPDPKWCSVKVKSCIFTPL